MDILKIHPGANLGPFVLGLSLPEVFSLLSSPLSSFSPSPSPSSFPPPSSPFSPLSPFSPISPFSPSSPSPSSSPLPSSSSSPPPSSLSPFSSSSPPPSLASFFAPIEFKYSEANPLQFDYVIEISKFGIKLKFDSCSQKLKLIAVGKLHALSLVFRGTVISSPDSVATLKTIVDLFGPTKPGRLTGDTYELSYPGITMIFNIGKEYQTKLRGEHSLSSHIPAPLSFLFIHSGDSWKFPKILYSPPLKDAQNRRGSFSARHTSSPLLSKKANHVTFQKGVSSVQSGVLPEEDEKGENEDDIVQIKISADGIITFLGLEMSLSFGAHCQDVMSVLGKPEGIFIKEKDPMSIYKSQERDEMFPNQEGAGDDLSFALSFGEGVQEEHLGLLPFSADYFFNYFTAGLDVLFDGRTHLVKKFILHTNFPGNADFNVYHKCHFLMEVPTENELKRTFVEEEEEAQTVGDLLGYPEFAPTKCQTRRKRIVHEKILVSPDSRWEDIRRELGRPQTPPLLVGKGNHVTPFGPSRAFGHGHVIFEVMPNDHISSVILFDDSD